MLSALAIIEDMTSLAAVEQLANETGIVRIAKTFRTVPGAFELSRALNLSPPDVVFVGAHWQEADEAVAVIRHASPRTALVYVDRALMDRDTFRDELSKAVRMKRNGTFSNLVAFVPAKAGSGCSTLALNVSGRLSTLGRRVLLIEADTRSGVLADRSGTDPSGALFMALDCAEQLSATRWAGLVSWTNGIDLLSAGRSTEPRMTAWNQWLQLLESAASCYDQVTVDLPEAINDGTAEIVRRANKVFIVATSEPASMILARQRRDELLARNVAPERVQVVVNRWHKGDPDASAVSRAMDQPVAGLIRNDYRSVRKAADEHRLIANEAPMAPDLDALARGIAGMETHEVRSRWRIFH